jgi:hypothetical protein
MDPDERVTMEERRRGYVQLRDSMADEAIAAELEATEYARRDLTPDDPIANGFSVLVIDRATDAVVLRRVIPPGAGSPGWSGGRRAGSSATVTVRPAPTASSRRW